MPTNMMKLGKITEDLVPTDIAVTSTAFFVFETSSSSDNALLGRDWTTGSIPSSPYQMLQLCDGDEAEVVKAI
ncbi:hypothetical protein ACH5RR_029839 [Cinchona calisaya]|uniref:Uncharacterized protein n=1 Tax=Cinchona calisaya TaxID=153742 RepID=A0ABD2YY17_9GENT